jgi:hypothetical protein
MKKKIKSPYNDLPYIKPENRMDPKRVKEFAKEFAKQIPEEISGHAIISITETEQPIFMYISDMKIAEHRDNFMASIIYNKKDKTIQIRGRIRHENDNKSGFESKTMPATEKNIKEQIEKIKSTSATLLKIAPELVEIFTENELTFPKNAKPKEILEIMEKSNLFNIGISHIDKEEEEEK